MDEPITLKQLNRQEALRYLGYSGGTADRQMEQLLSRCEKKLLLAAVPRFLYQVFRIRPTNAGIQVEGTNLCLPGRSIAAHLAGCDCAVLMAATVSESVDRLLRVAQLEDMAEAVVLDSLAGVAVEQVCDQTEARIRRRFPDRYQTFRFGLGYGDLPVTLQADFLKVLDAPRKIGLNVDSSSMLVPVKSVTAVIGLSGHPLDKSVRGCWSCNLRERCQFREKGGHCNG